MDFDNIKNEWQQQNIGSSKEVIKHVIKRDERLKKENLVVTIFCSITITILGYFVLFSVSENQISMFVVMGLMFLMGFQPIIFWMRNLPDNFMANKNSIEQLKSTRSKLKYNLLVTNIFMPIYFVVLSVLVYFYIDNLEALPDTWKIWIMIPTGVFMMTIFIYGWFKQRRKDEEEIIPLLESVEASLLEG